MIPAQKVKIIWKTNNRAWFIERGYEFTNYGDTFEVSEKDVQPTSKTTKIIVNCDYCSCNYTTTMYNYTRAKNSSKLKKDMCNTKECKTKKLAESNLTLYGKTTKRIKEKPITIIQNGEEVILQTCTRCEKPKPISEFWADTDTETGTYSWCIECTKKYRQTDQQKPKTTKYQKEYYQENKTAISDYKKQWYKNRQKSKSKKLNL